MKLHCYADDTLMNSPKKTNENNQVNKLQDYFKDIKAWMTCTFFYLQN